VQFEIGDAAAHRAMRARQETRAHPVGDIAEPQVEACGLNLIGCEGTDGHDPARVRQFGDHAVRQDALVVRREGKRHAYLVFWPI
jgi:hypothetical protein